MVLTYSKYIELLFALDEHCKGKLEKHELQDAIFNHYMSINRTLVAENAKGSKKLFTTQWQGNKNNKAERKKFRNFMNEELITEHKKKNKLCQRS